MKSISTSMRPFCALLLAVLILQGCNALNPLCRSARPAPVLNSLSTTSITFAEVQSGFVLTLTGSDILRLLSRRHQRNYAQHPNPEQNAGAGDYRYRANPRSWNRQCHHQHSQWQLRRPRLLQWRNQSRSRPYDHLEQVERHMPQTWCKAYQKVRTSVPIGTFVHTNMAR